MCIFYSMPFSWLLLLGAGILDAASPTRIASSCDRKEILILG
jgi:hypothetical protein